MPRGRLSKQEKYIIEGMIKDNHSIAEIAKELGRTEKSVETYAKTIEKPKPKKKKKKQEPAKPLIAKDLMVNVTAMKKSKGVSMMTEAASQRGDVSKNKDSVTISRTARDAIFKINNDE
tara:strand:+ start:1000 stop:1356 length:357 start_codon:yes stop_codon:yes gene_type:complete